MRYIAGLSLCFLLLPAYSQASPASELHKINAALNAQSRKEEQLNARDASLREQVDSMRADLTQLASRVQQREQVLNGLELSIAELKQALLERQVQLSARREAQQQLFFGMLRHASVPDSLLLARPDDLRRHFMAVSLMQQGNAALAAQARELGEEIEALEATRQELEEKRQAKERAGGQLARARRALESRLLARESLRQQLKEDRSAIQAEVEALSRKAHSLRGLIAELEAEREAAARDAVILPRNKPQRGRAEATAPVKSAAVDSMWLPVNGTMLHDFGDRLPNGQAAEGVHLKTLEKALVVAPAAGSVVYAGPFRGYGNLVILRHDRENHTLLSGMASLDVKTGVQVQPGEPIGRMPTLAEANPVLYVERRQDNRPVRPAPWLPAQPMQQLASKSSTVSGN